jgi:LysR family hydrogen peroxide-inducible transcriptional activator
MNIRDFEYLIAIDKLKSFTKASKECYISQPALSQQVAKIENQLDVKIFERSKRSIITTKKGLEIIRRAKIIISSYDKIKNIKNDDKEIRIGLIPTICPYLLPIIVNNLNKELPDIRFYFLELKTKDLLSKLNDGEVDIAILGYFERIMDDRFIYEKLYDEEFLLTLPRSSRLEENDFDQIVDDKKLILLEEGNCMSDNIKDICELHDKNSYNDFFATNIETVKNMVKINNGCALLPKLSCLNEIDLKLVSFKNKKYREVGVMSRDNYDDKKLIDNINIIVRDSVANVV